MTDFWGFLLQTLYVSLVGGLLLVVKSIFWDKLTPRWQYGVWSVLALRILIPVGMTWKYVLLSLPLWVETTRILAEHAIPAVVFIWLYRLYLVGVAVFLARYLFSYFRLRRLLKRGEAPTPELTEQIKYVAERYGLKPCKAVIIQGLTSPMVCGVFRPVLAVPEDARLDDHVILHELLHVKHCDALQNVFWSLCRALHWCNPFVHHCINQIGNDIESLCDQRVLECLEGEDRRTYGLSLLAMANDKYPRAPGTTSISNGGQNISRRVEAIVRFKKYPKGMALASVCVTVLLACGCMFPASVQGLVEAEEGASLWQIARAEASLHLVRCSTVAGAIDTYAKGLIEGNRDYMTLASSEPTEFTRKVQIHDYTVDYDAMNANYFDTGKTTEIDLSEWSESFVIHNLRPLSEDAMAAELVFLLGRITDDPLLLKIEDEEYSVTGAVQIPIRIEKGEGWTVRENDPAILYLADLAKTNATDLWLGGDPYHPGIRYEGSGKSGIVVKESLTQHYIGEQNAGFWGVQGYYTPIPNPNASFSHVNTASVVTYQSNGTQETEDAVSKVILQFSSMERSDWKPYFTDSFAFNEGSWGTEFGNHSGSFTTEVAGPDWDGIVELGVHESFDYNDYPDHGGGVQIRWNGEVVDELILQEVSE